MTHVVLSLSVPTVHQKRFRMILPQCAACQESVRTARSDDYFHVRPFHCHVHNCFSYLVCFELNKTICGVAMAIMIFNWNNEK